MNTTNKINDKSAKKKPRGKPFPANNNANPAGRPRIADTIGEVLRVRLCIPENHRPPARTPLEKIAENMIRTAEKSTDATGNGVSMAMKLLFDRAYGQAHQSVAVKMTTPPPELDIKKLSEKELEAYRAIIAKMDNAQSKRD